MRKYVWAIVIALLLATGIGLFILFFYSNRFDPSKLEGVKSPTIIKDMTGQEVMRIQPSGHESTSIASIPLDLQHGLISIEDTRFYQNSGIDFRSVARALFIDLTHQSAIQGASTIPEQLAKMVYLNDNKSMSYKIKQMVYGIQIEQDFTKDQILEFYLNHVYLGHGATGVAEAASVYFNKPVSKLTLAESALLAGLPQAPSYYDPFVNKQAALERRNMVLKQMLTQHYITDSQYQQAVNQPIQLTPGELHDGIPPELRYYRDYLYEEADRVGIGATTLSNGGITVYTSLNPKLQKAAYDSYQNPRYFPPDMKGQSVQSGAAFINPKTGGLEAIIGSRGQYVERGLDHATQIQRSPGSSIKPLVVYGPAIQSGAYQPNSLLSDGINGSYDFGGYQVNDWDYGRHQTYNGKVSVRFALAQSLNVPAVWLLQKIGIDTGIHSAEKAGLTFSDADHQHLGVALGDISNGANPMQMADAYASFDNNGQRVEAHAIQKITNEEGVPIYSATPETTQVFNLSTVKTMLSLLQNNVVNGLASSAAIPGWDVAGKTGSTQFDGTSGDRDVWFCGFTPTVVGSIWMGFDNTDTQHYITAESGGSAKPAQLFSAILREGLDGPGQRFEQSVSQDVYQSTADQNTDEQQSQPASQVPQPGNGKGPGKGKNKNHDQSNIQNQTVPQDPSVSQGQSVPQDPSVSQGQSVPQDSSGTQGQSVPQGQPSTRDQIVPPGNNRSSSQSSGD